MEMNFHAQDWKNHQGFVFSNVWLVKNGEIFVYTCTTGEKSPGLCLYLQLSSLSFCINSRGLRLGGKQLMGLAGMAKFGENHDPQEIKTL